MDVQWHLTVVLVWCLVQLVHSVPLLAAMWCPTGCQCYFHYTMLDCSAKGLIRIPVLPNTTKRLDMENNRITRVNKYNFKNVPKLILLNLQANKISKIELGSFSKLRLLQELDLGQNLLTHFQTGDTLLPELLDLDLSGNKLHYIPRNLSGVAPHLQKLNLSNNQLMSIVLDWRYGSLRSLISIDFRNNPILRIGPHDLDPLRRIPMELLYLSYCGINDIDRRALRGLLNLTSLSLAGNTIPAPMLAEALQGVGNGSQLLTLDISHMVLQNITPPMLSNFARLEVLDLSYSGLEYIDPKVFDFLPQLFTLLLNGNYLMKLQNLSALRKLATLLLRGNKIRDPMGLAIPSLKELDLSDNSIEYIPENWLQMGKLQCMNLSHNRIRDISGQAFRSVTMVALDLSHNRLTRMKCFGLLQVTTLFLVHNNIRQIEPGSFKYFYDTLVELDLSYNNMSRLPNQPMQDLKGLRKLNLAHNQLGPSLRTATHDSMLHRLGHLQVLDLSWNTVTQLSHQQFQYLHHLTTLQLQHNRVTNLDDLSLTNMKSLSSLDMSHNRLEVVYTAILDVLQYLEYVDLSGNPYNCKCSLVPFLVWLNTTKLTVINLHRRDRYQCARPAQRWGQYILSYHPSLQACLSQVTITQGLTIFGIAATVLALAILCTVLLIYYGKMCHRLKNLHYRWQIRYREVSGIEIQAAELAAHTEKGSPDATNCPT